MRQWRRARQRIRFGGPGYLFRLPWLWLVAGCVTVVLSWAAWGLVQLPTASSMEPRPGLEAWRLSRLARQMEPLVSAIHRYEADHGHPPEMLYDLGPTYQTELVPEAEFRCRLYYGVINGHWWLSIPGYWSDSGYPLYAAHSRKWCLTPGDGPTLRLH